MQTEERQNIFTEENNRYKVRKHKHKKATNQIEKRCKYMKKKYVCPKVDIINTRLESEILAGSKGNAGSDDFGGAKAYGGDLDDFTDESMWGDEIDGNN